MNIDENVRKLLTALLRKWRLLVIFLIIGALAGYFYTAKFTTPTYSSTVEFKTSAVDPEADMKDSASNQATSAEAVRISNTSKMNYLKMMIDTYIEIMGTNNFNSRVAEELNERINSNYKASDIKGSTTFEVVNNTAMFKIIVTTTDADLSYEIAHQLELTVPKVIDEASNNIVNASVEDRPLRADTHTNKGYPKKCAISGLAGLVLAAAYVILRTLLDVRIKSADELVDVYNIPVLASIPCFEGKKGSQSAPTAEDYSSYIIRKGDEK